MNKEYNFQEGEYLDLLHYVLNYGQKTVDRTGVGTLSINGPQITYDLSDDVLPVITTKKIHLPSVIHELLWFIKGDTNTDYLVENGVRIWNEWADENGDLGPVYGYQWRKFPCVDGQGDNTQIIGHVDQLAQVQDMIRNDPTSRRIILSAWNPGMVHNMALPPCHCFVQFFVNPDNTLDCMLYQRSADLFLGVPFNVTSYSLLTHMLAATTGRKPGKLIHNMGNAHIYLNHIEQVKEQLLREPYSFPKLKLQRQEHIDFYTYKDIEVLDYEHHPLIKAVVAV